MSEPETDARASWVDVTGSCVRWRVRGDVYALIVIAIAAIGLSVLLAGSAPWWLIPPADALLAAIGCVMRLLDRRREPPTSWLLRDVWGLKAVGSGVPSSEGEHQVRWMDGYLMRAGLLSIMGGRASLRRMDGAAIPPASAGSADPGA